jgi:hypothetical protein
VNTLVFNRNVAFGPTLSGMPDQNELRHVPMFYRASASYAYRLGGPFVRKVIDSVPLDPRFRHVSIDSRVHMLMPGWLPCIGGWHCDDFWRPTGKQPDLADISIDNDNYCRHHTVCVGPVAMTEFCVTPIEMNVYDEVNLPGENIYARYNQEIDVQANRGMVETRKAVSGQLVSFDSFAFHRGTVSEGHGWRLFMRVTESNHWEPKDEIRTQTQVYLQSFEAGW